MRIHTTSKLQVLNAYILSVITYGCKTWPPFANFHIDTYFRTCYICYIISICVSDFVANEELNPRAGGIALFSTTIN